MLIILAPEAGLEHRLLIAIPFSTTQFESGAPDELSSLARKLPLPIPFRALMSDAQAWASPHYRDLHSSSQSPARTTWIDSWTYFDG